MASVSPPKLSLLDRLLGRRASIPTNGRKSSSVSGVQLTDMRVPDFFSEDGLLTIYRLTGGGNSEQERVTAETAYAAAAYAYVAMRYRASSLATPPLMVVNEDRKSGMPEWLPRHGLAPLLEMPSPDFDMGELLFRTSISVDQTGHALWFIDQNGLGRAGRLTPFTGREFEIKSTDSLLRGQFILKTTKGERKFGPERVVYFHEVDPATWLKGLSRLDVMLAWLNLSQHARATVRDLLENAIWPSVVLQPAADWNPSPEEFELYKKQAAEYSKTGSKGGALPMIGGGTATIVSPRIRDLIPEDILNRVEAVTSSVFGIPAIVLQFQVGMENSPWSQMAEARRMCYEDTIEPLWRDYEKRITRQLLRPMDQNTSHFVRFDTSQIRALQKDKQVQSSIAVMWERIASLNERRQLVGLEPVEDPVADEIPELRPPPSPLDPFGEELEDEEEEETEKGRRRAWHRKARRTLAAALRADQVESLIFEWQLAVHKQLELDRDAIAKIARAELTQKAETPTPASNRRVLAAVDLYLIQEAEGRWKAALTPLLQKTGRRAVSAVANNLGLRFDLLKPGLVKYTEREAGWLIKGIAETTREAVAKTIAAGLEQGQGIRAIARELETSHAFSKQRAELVARTESTRVNNGAPTETLKAREAETGRKFRKRWNTAGDDRVRDEHAELEGEEKDLDEPFSNGLDFPSEPNCRCVLTYEEVEV